MRGMVSLVETMLGLVALLPPWLLHQLLSQKNTVLSICLCLSNLDCDRKREHGISPISLSLEKCFVKHNGRKINSQTEQFQDISK